MGVKTTEPMTEMVTGVDTVIAGSGEDTFRAKGRGRPRAIRQLWVKGLVRRGQRETPGLVPARAASRVPPDVCVAYAQ